MRRVVTYLISTAVTWFLCSLFVWVIRLYLSGEKWWGETIDMVNRGLEMGLHRQDEVEAYAGTLQMQFIISIILSIFPILIYSFWFWGKLSKKLTLIFSIIFIILLITSI